MTLSNIKNDSILINISKEQHIFCKKIMELLNEKPLNPELFETERLSFPNLTEDDSAIHRAIIKDILKENRSFMDFSGFSAFFVGYLPESHLKFKTLNQKLNLALNAIYGRNTPRLDPMTQDFLDSLLHNHLLTMQSSNLFNNKKITNAVNLIANHFIEKIGLNLTDSESIKLDIDLNYLSAVNKEYTQYAEERSLLKTELEEFKAQYEEEKNNHANEITKIYDLLKKLPPKPSLMSDEDATPSLRSVI